VADPYEKYADIFMASMAGEMSGLTKEQFIAVCKAKFPIEAEFVATMEAMTAQVEGQIAEVQANLKPGQSLAVGYRVETPSGPLH
jgi:hypothetical protein